MHKVFDIQKCLCFSLFEVNRNVSLVQGYGRTTTTLMWSDVVFCYEN